MAAEQDFSPDRNGDVASRGITWRNYAGTFLGVDPRDRLWGVAPTLTGWRLEVQDTTDTGWTQAGTYPTREAAQRAASDA